MNEVAYLFRFSRGNGRRAHKPGKVLSV